MLSGNASTLIMIGGLALAAFFLLRNSRGFFSRSRPKDNDPQQIRQLLGERSRDSALADAPPEVLRWQVEMHETARDLKAELDSKLSALQALILLARQERERLEQTLKLAGRGGLPQAPPARSSAEPVDPPHDLLEAIEGLADPAALADPQAMSRLAAQMPARPGGRGVS
ncbi:MAG: hypothetical protein SFU86_05760 [Pirellulaceae bacterium]|nr:hypothetical protein [Pirellulaceae bacterium]